MPRKSKPPRAPTNEQDTPAAPATQAGADDPFPLVGRRWRTKDHETRDQLVARVKRSQTLVAEKYRRRAELEVQAKVNAAKEFAKREAAWAKEPLSKRPTIKDRNIIKGKILTKHMDDVERRLWEEETPPPDKGWTMHQAALVKLGFPADYWLPWKVARQWQCIDFPKHQTQESIQQWQELTEKVAKNGVAFSTGLDQTILDHLANDLDLLRQHGCIPAGTAPCQAIQSPVVRGQAGRRGYPLEALNYAMDLRAANPLMKVHTIRQRCLERIDKDNLPPEDDAFRRWLNRKRANRAN